MTTPRLTHTATATLPELTAGSLADICAQLPRDTVLNIRPEYQRDGGGYIVTATWDVMTTADRPTQCEHLWSQTFADPDAECARCGAVQRGFYALTEPEEDA